MLKVILDVYKKLSSRVTVTATNDPKEIEVNIEKRQNLKMCNLGK